MNAYLNAERGKDDDTSVGATLNCDCLSFVCPHGILDDKGYKYGM